MRFVLSLLVAAGAASAAWYYWRRRHALTGLHAVGWNGFGQLGSGDVDPRSRAALVPLAAGSLECIGAGGLHYAGFSATVVDGALWTWGANAQGQLGLGDAMPRLRPTLAPLAHRVVAVACGTQHLVVLLEHGSAALSAGDNSFAQLGRTGSAASLLAPVTAVEGPFRAVACGDAHTLLLRVCGTVAAVGSNSFGQCNSGALESIIAVACGHSHALALDADGIVWAWGSDEYGQRGVRGKSAAPHRVPGMAKAVSAIAAGARHSLALLRDGSALFGWGCNEHAQLLECEGDDAVVVASPHMLQLEGPVCGVFAGGFHTGAVLGSGAVVVRGCNAEGQLGVDASTITVGRWTRVVGITAPRAVAAADTHTLFSM